MFLHRSAIFLLFTQITANYRSLFYSVLFYFILFRFILISFNLFIYLYECKQIDVKLLWFFFCCWNCWFSNFVSKSTEIYVWNTNKQSCQIGKIFLLKYIKIIDKNLLNKARITLKELNKYFFLLIGFICHKRSTLNFFSL